ncbi:MAG: DUF3160 domain-containing protein [Thermoplasmatota archaeon]
MKHIMALLVVMVFLASGLSGCLTAERDVQVINIPSVTASASSDPQVALAGMYRQSSASINASAPSYNLPLDLDDIENLAEIDAAFELTDGQREMLQRNGFVVVDGGPVSDISHIYRRMQHAGLPIFVTSDTLLHLYHVQFSQLLKQLEEEVFYDSIRGLSLAMADRAEIQYQAFNDATLKEAARRNLAFFTVASQLLDAGTVPSSVEDMVEGELDYIEAHDGYHKSDIFGYKEDYSQYVPRGHYTSSETLQRYFRALMWYGRMAFLLKGGTPYGPAHPYLVSEHEATIATVQAALIATGLPQVEVGNETGWDAWQRIYAITSFFVGTADDLTPHDYMRCLNESYGDTFNASMLANASMLQQLKGCLAQLPGPRIYGGTGQCAIAPPFTKEQLDEVLAKTAGLRFMGQRFVPDSYMFQQLVAPMVGTYTGSLAGNASTWPFTLAVTGGGPARCFPRGLDVMAVLGSQRAEDILRSDGDTDYAGMNTSYDGQLSMLQEQFDGFNVTDWNRNLYWSWLYALQPLLGEYGAGYPAFMQTRAWRDKQLNAALASWTQLRHDTILYAKQSNTPVLTGLMEAPGYVEPVPRLYTRLQSLVNMTRQGLDAFGVLDSEGKARLDALHGMLGQLFSLAKKELEGTPFDSADTQFLYTFVRSLNQTMVGVNERGRRLPMVADVHTDGNTEQCLEEAVGYADVAIVAYMLPDGTILAGAGPTYSYYEFKQPISQRLTDEDWLDMLSQPPERPDWTTSFTSFD